MEKYKQEKKKRKRVTIEWNFKILTVSSKALKVSILIGILCSTIKSIILYAVITSPEPLQAVKAIWKEFLWRSRLLRRRYRMSFNSFAFWIFLTFSPFWIFQIFYQLLYYAVLPSSKFDSLLIDYFFFLSNFISFYLFIYLFIYLSIYLFVSLSIRLFFLFNTFIIIIVIIIFIIIVSVFTNKIVFIVLTVIIL